MAGDPVAKGFSLTTLVATAAATLGVMGSLAFEVRPVAELDALTITALLFGFFNALGVLLWSGVGRTRQDTAVSDGEIRGTTPDTVERKRALASPNGNEIGRPLPFPDRRKAGATDRRRVHSGGRRSTDGGFPMLVSSAQTADVIRIRGTNFAPHS